MNLDLILENIRLGHIEALLQEATTDLEVVRGQRLINESIMQLRGVLMEEVSIQELKNSTRRTIKPGMVPAAAGMIGADAIGSGLVGAAGGAAGGAILNGALDTDGLAGDGALLGAGLGVAVPLTQLAAGTAANEQGRLRGINQARAARSINRRF
jgi:hypothetical protein